MNHAAAAVLLFLPFVPAQPIVDSDLDGVADDLDVCALGDDDVDTDGDGTADACDCAPNDPDVGPLVPDACDGLDNNCDGRIDRRTVFDVRGAELFGRIGRGLAANDSTRTLQVSGTSLSVETGLISEVYYQEQLDLVTVGGAREVTIRLERVPTTGDNDVEVALTDGTRTIAYGIFNDSQVNRYIAAAHAGVTTGTHFASEYPLRPAEDVSFPDLDQAYLFTFRATDAGTSVSLHGSKGYASRSPVTFPLEHSLDPNVPWTLLLIGNSPLESYEIEALAVHQPWPDDDGSADGDGDGYPASCDCADDDPLVNPAAFDGCDGLDRDCRAQAYLAEESAVFGGLGSRLVDDIRSGYAKTNANRSVVADGTALVVPPAASGSNQVYYRARLPLFVPAGDDVLEVLVEVDRVAAAGDHDFEVGVAFDPGSQPLLFTAGLHDADGSTGARYEVRGSYGQLYPDQTIFAPSLLTVTSGVVLDEAGPWLFTFQVSATSVTAEVRSADGQTATLAYPTPPEPGTGQLELALFAPSAGHSFTIKSLDVAVKPPDADGDGVCDFLDWCAGFDGSNDRDGDGVPEGCDCNDLRAEIGPQASEVCDGIDGDCDGQTDFARIAGGAGTELAAEITRGQARGPSGAWTSVDERTIDTPYGYENGYAKTLGDVRRSDGSTTLRLRLNFHGRKLLALSDGNRVVALDQSGTDVWVSTRIEASLSPEWRFNEGPFRPQCLSAYGPHDSRCTFGTVQGHAGAGPDDVMEVLFVADEDGQRIVSESVWGSWYYVASYSALAQGNVAVIPTNAQLDLSRPITAFVFGSRITEASVSAALDDADDDFVCDARDVCPGQDDRRDADLDGVPDACDMCFGPDSVFDADGDGVPSGCDCDDADAERYPGKSDVCDDVDNDCDLLTDVDTLVSARGVEISSQLLRGEATGASVRTVTPIFEGSAVQVGPSSGAARDVWYRRSIGALRTGTDETRVIVKFDRAPAVGDHDFHVALSDGQTAFGLALLDAGNSVGLAYEAVAFVAADQSATVLPPVYGDAKVLDDATPYEVEFVFGADPRLEVLTARNERFTLRPPNPAAAAGMRLATLDALLLGHSPGESYTVRSLEVRQRLDDADGDGVCDAVDFCAGADDTGLDSDGDGIVDPCDVCAFGPDGDDEDGDGVPDACDRCAEGDDALDADGDAVPDACDACPDDYANDADGDGVCDLSDACFGFDDGEDFDGDGVADGCDACPLDAENDSDEDGSCDSADVCRGSDRSGDDDGDGWCGDLDCDDTRAHIHLGADEVCDGFDSDCDGQLDGAEMDLDHDGVIDCIAELAAAADAGPAADAGGVPPTDPGCSCSQGGSRTSTAPWGLALLGVLALFTRRRVVGRGAVGRGAVGRGVVAAGIVACVLQSGAATAQNGLSDDRVSLPDGPGSIGGIGENVEVDGNMGAASFSVPLRVPEGSTPAMTPSLALSYSSGQGLGAAGIGWDLSSPAIERMTSKGLPEYDTDDLFMADGSELVYVGDAGDAREYRARFEGAFARYRWHDVGDGSAGYWTAEYPDGRVATYGATADGVVQPLARVQSAEGRTFRYHLVELVDPSGRRLVQAFEKTGGWPRVAEIQYGFGALSTPRFAVRVGYESRPDVTRDATPGHVITLDQRISAIDVYSLSERIRRYELVYESEAESGGMSRLAGVRELGREGGVLPIEHHFRYSRSLGGACEIGCEQPVRVDMGTLPGGVSVATGRAALLDINGDSMPDVVASDDTGKHTFHVSSFSGTGDPVFASTPHVSDMGGTTLSFVLGAPGVQVLDVNGDGLTDIVNQATGDALCNFGNGDWESEGCATSPDELPVLEDDAEDPASSHDPLGMRFFDYDNDKRIDLLRTLDVDTTQVYRNTGDGFVAVDVEAVGAQFDVEELQLSDVNGDGLQDPVLLVSDGGDGQLRYRLNLGFGRWSAFTDVVVPGLAAAEVDDAVLEDLDGDGLSDVVVVAGTTISFWRNLNDDRFAAREDITGAMVAGGIPDNDGTQTVLFADMNGNGTDDVVYLSTDGHVQFVELFPVRPNLLSRVDNGIGWVRTLRYGTAAAERARDEGTAEQWVSKQPNAVVVVTESDTFVTLTGDEDGSGLHERTVYRYHDGYYDPAEKAFRGFGKVERLLVSDAAEDGQEPGLEVLTYDVGRSDVYFAGRLLRSRFFGGADLDVPLRESRTEYAECALGNSLLGPPLDELSPPVRWICPVAMEEIHQEGAAESEWATTRTEYEYDIYGNTEVERRLGVVHRGPPEAPGACGPCEGPEGLDSGACGATCEGDELYRETTFIAPGPDTGGRWLLRLPSRSLLVADEGADPVERVFSYDGDDFVGLPNGQASRGLLSRVVVRTGPDTFVDETRAAYDDLGNVIATLDPNGDPADATAHRRDYELDERGLRVTRVTFRAGAYDLVQEVQYEAVFLQVSEATSVFVVEGGEAKTPRNSTRYRYDEHGRVVAIIKPGDSDAAPSEEIGYALADPVSTVTRLRRRAPGGAADVETVSCLDGRGRQTQTMQRVADGEYLVSGFEEVNSRNEPVRSYQPFTRESATCEGPPAGVPFAGFRYDAMGRLVATSKPDEDLYGSASTTRNVFQPLITETWDEEDTDPESPFRDTPRRQLFDGLGRTVSFERLLPTTSGAPEVASYRLGYDEQGRLAQVIDPAGNAQEQAYDLAGRVVSVTDPNTGTTEMVYDDAGLVIERTDARGVTVHFEYDALNRPLASYAAADREGTEERLRYDYDDGCTDCRNGAGRLVGRTYPVGDDRFGYDARGRKVLEQRTLEGFRYERGWLYDGVDALVSATYPDGQELTMQHDDASRVVAIDGIVDEVRYGASGELEAVRLVNGVESQWSYDATMRLSRVRHGDFFDTTLTRGRADHVTAVASAGTGIPRDREYVTDAWYRLLEATLPGDEVLRVGYDLVDNITSQTSSRGADSPAHVGAYRYDAARPNLLASLGEVAYGYDEAGNATARGDHAMTWDHLQRLTTATAPEQPEARFHYAALGERVMKEERGGVAHYVGDDFVVRDGIASLYVELGDTIVARLRSKGLGAAQLDRNADDEVDIVDALSATSDEDRSRLLRAVARRVLFDASDATVGLHVDAQGSLVAVTNAAGELVAERDFYPFGEERIATGFVDERGFSARERDESTGMLHFRFREYDAQAGRWLSDDPAFAVLTAENVDRLGESTTGYAYVGNDPVNATDPSGLFAKKLVSKLKGKIKSKMRKARYKKRLKRLMTDSESGAGMSLKAAQQELRIASYGKDRMRAFVAGYFAGEQRLTKKQIKTLERARESIFEALREGDASKRAGNFVSKQDQLDLYMKDLHEIGIALTVDRAFKAGVQSAAGEKKAIQRFLERGLSPQRWLDTPPRRAGSGPRRYY